VLCQYADDSLSSGQISRAQQNYDAITATFEHRHFAELGEVVDARVGAGVGGENHSLVEHHADAIRHAMRLVCNQLPVRNATCFWLRGSAGERRPVRI
jgi:hypothetical protein